MKETTKEIEEYDRRQTSDNNVRRVVFWEYKTVTENSSTSSAWVTRWEMSENMSLKS